MVPGELRVVSSSVIRPRRFQRSGQMQKGGRSSFNRELSVNPQQTLNPNAFRAQEDPRDKKTRALSPEKALSHGTRMQVCHFGGHHRHWFFLLSGHPRRPGVQGTLGGRQCTTLLKACPADGVTTEFEMVCARLQSLPCQTVSEASCARTVSCAVVV